MGTQQVTLTVLGSVSRHNSDQDRTDDALWDEFTARVEAIAREHRYESIGLYRC